MTKPRIEGSLCIRRAEFVYGAYRLYAAAIHAPIVNGPWETRDEASNPSFSTQSRRCVARIASTAPRKCKTTGHGLRDDGLALRPGLRRC